jgi:hypothetical protein
VTRTKTKSFTLKAGAEHNGIVNGDYRLLKGDGKSVKVDLTEEQAQSFRDKIVEDPAFDEEAAKANQAAEGDNVLNAPESLTIVEANARDAIARGDADEDSVNETSGADEVATTPAGAVAPATASAAPNAAPTGTATAAKAPADKK